MKFPERWLREFIDNAPDTHALAEQLTAAGLEIESVEPVCDATLDNVVVGRVLEAWPHPQADRLRVCRVDVGASEPLSIVCGAPNARAGLVCVVALPGARLPGGVKIRKSKIRGETSNGMICSASELSLGEEADGVLELDNSNECGARADAVLELDDAVFEIGLTPNRGDCLYVEGIARDVAAINGQRLQHREVKPVAAKRDDTFDVRLVDPKRCPRYVGRVISNIDVTRSTPLWMQERLRRAGVRPLSPVVDVTNYVMLELGHPMHAFDMDRLHDHIDVRVARQGETIQLLDDSQQVLSETDLVIADGDGAVALAGIMGGASSAVSDTTRNVFLECAWFEPRGISVTARRLGLHTDASHRFERVVNPEGQMRAVERASELLQLLVGGEPGPLVDTCDAAHLPRAPRIRLRASRIERLLGEPLTDAVITEVLHNLHLSVETAEEPQQWWVTPPPFRPDITIEADLIEELVRIRGYDCIGEQMPLEPLQMSARAEHEHVLRTLRRVLTARGYQEAITYSFVDSRLQQLLEPDIAAIALSNPIASDMDVMRTSLLPGLLSAAQYNVNRQQERVRLFETGLVFRNEGERTTVQRPMLAGLAMGARTPVHWDQPSSAVDLFDVKADVAALFGARAPQLRFVALQCAALHPGRSAQLSIEGRAVGIIGELHPMLVRELKFAQPPVAFELELAMLRNGGVASFSPFSRYPGVRRDLSVLVDETVTMEAVADCVGQAAGDMLQNLELFDLYRGEGIDPGRKSLALALTFQDASRTLGDQEVDVSMQQIQDSLAKHLGATLRG